MSFEVNNFFKHGFGEFGTVENFKESWAGKYFEALYGELVFLPYSKLKFITMDTNGYFFDEIYTQKGMLPNQVGTLIPKQFVSLKKEDSDGWKKLHEDGYYIVEDVDLPKELVDKLEDETYYHHDSLPNSIMFPSYNDKEEPSYVKEIAYFLNDKLGLIKSDIDISTDSIKYIYDPNDKEDKGPYKYHMDFMKDINYMFFYYRSKKPIEGRELLIGERKLRSLDMSSVDIKDICKNNSKVKDKAKIQVKDKMLIALNTYNPRFMHRVEKLKEDNEVVLLTNYVKKKGS